jgi:hypothetical protein
MQSSFGVCGSLNLLAPRRVSQSFKSREMLSDSDLSEDYDADPYFIDFNDQHRYPTFTPQPPSQPPLPQEQDQPGEDKEEGKV